MGEMIPWLFGPIFHSIFWAAKGERGSVEKGGSEAVIGVGRPLRWLRVLFVGVEGERKMRKRKGGRGREGEGRRDEERGGMGIGGEAKKEGKEGRKEMRKGEGWELEGKKGRREMGGEGRK
ncbi:ATP-dependent RNA helicase DDX42, partial [Ophiophagus hannah]